MATPLSLYSIPVVWFTTFHPMNMKVALTLLVLKIAHMHTLEVSTEIFSLSLQYFLIDKTIGYNNLQPRSNTKRLVEDSCIPREVALRVERLEGAHLNGNEVLPLWIGAVLAGNQAGISNETMNAASVGFIVSRFLYNYVYINHTTSSLSWLRSALFFTGLGFPMYLFVKAGNIVRERI
ncbi:hypothetical protein EW145_g5550 [Phellinidium pouzarii]|uniref:Uncharacterized protein n=1 Tax=Phellinidium pouzarii TaxID=167371 RepID=A0A4V3XC38_9AGAM|nr:hypothetical protein EW145_g5550 [Phellinidium pouzarii]